MFEKIDRMVCVRCGCTLPQATKRGAYFARVGPKGVPATWECKPSCAGSFDPRKTTVEAVTGAKS